MDPGFYNDEDPLGWIEPICPSGLNWAMPLSFDTLAREIRDQEFVRAESAPSRAVGPSSPREILAQINWEDIFPGAALKRLRQSDFNPLIIGSQYRLGDVAGECAAIRTYRRRKKIARPIIGLDLMPPEQIDWIADYLEAVRLTQKQPHPRSGETEYQRMYRASLEAHHGELLALSLMEEGYEVVPLEVPGILQRLPEIKTQAARELEGMWNQEARNCAIAWTVQLVRSGDCLGIIDRQRPHVLAIGSARAALFDFLFQRKRSDSAYFPESARETLAQEAAAVSEAAAALMRMRSG